MIDCDKNIVFYFCLGFILGFEFIFGIEFILNKVKENGMMVCLDINYCLVFWDDIVNVLLCIDEVVKKVFVLKVSWEEFVELYGEENVDIKV